MSVTGSQNLGIIKTSDGITFEDEDDVGRILVSGADTDGKYSLLTWQVAAGADLSSDGSPQFGPHLHRECEETFLVQSGTLEFLLDDTVTTLGPGDFVRVPAGTRHGYANISNAPVDLLVSFLPAGLEELFLKYRTDGESPSAGPGFIADATEQFASEFEE